MSALFSLLKLQIASSLRYFWDCNKIDTAIIARGCDPELSLGGEKGYFGHLIFKLKWLNILVVVNQSTIEEVVDLYLTSFKAYY
jgi:hypothetical protein